MIGVWVERIADSTLYLTKGRKYEVWGPDQLTKTPEYEGEGPSYVIMNDMANIVAVSAAEFTPCGPPYYKDSYHRNWGSDVVPKEEWIDPHQNYTCDGCPVVNIEIKLLNSAGREITYPVVGHVRKVNSRGKLSLERRSWTLDGRASTYMDGAGNLVKVAST